MTNGGRRIATATGAMLADPDRLGNSAREPDEHWFDPQFWRARTELQAAGAGRGSAWFVGPGERQWVLRHFRRGGFIARFSQDEYVWSGEHRVRAFAEWRLLDTLSRRGLPVPAPVAARYQRSGFRYRCDLITVRIEGAEALSAVLARRPIEAPEWRAAGAVIAGLHRAGADHADLNAHNLLIDARGAVSVVDFDRGRMRTPGAWAAANLERLHRSLAKIGAALPPGRFTDRDWQALLAGYGAA